MTDGRPIEKLREILGHSTVQVTERYAHLSPDAFGKADYAAVCVNLKAELDPADAEGSGAGLQHEKGGIGHNRGTMAKTGPRKSS